MLQYLKILIPHQTCRVAAYGKGEKRFLQTEKPGISHGKLPCGIRREKSPCMQSNLEDGKKSDFQAYHLHPPVPA